MAGFTRDHGDTAHEGSANAKNMDMQRSNSRIKAANYLQ
jgi:hypothetical protein